MTNHDPSHHLNQAYLLLLPFTSFVSVPLYSCSYAYTHPTGTLTHDGIHRVLKLEGSKMNKVADFFVREMASAVPVVPSVIFSSVDKVQCCSMIVLTFITFHESWFAIDVTGYLQYSVK